MYYFYYLPIGTEIRLRRIPWLTLLLILMNTLVFCYFRYHPKGWAVIAAWALVPNQPDITNALMANFLHATWGHLIGNMLYLWLFGAPVEDRIGPVWLLVTFLGLGAISLLAQAALTLALLPQFQGIAILGASGGVSAVTGIFLVRFYYARVRVAIPTLLLLRGFKRGSDLQLPALAVVAIWSALQFMNGVLALMQKQSATAYGAHIAGIILGFGLGLTFGVGKGALQERLRLKADRYFRDSRWYEAQDAYGRCLAEAPADVSARLQLARAHMLTRQDASAAREYARVIQLAAGQKTRNRELRDAYLEMRRLLPMHGLPVSLQRRVAEELEETGQFYEAAEAWERSGRLDDVPERAVPALFRAARLAHASLGDSPRAVSIYHSILERFPENSASETARQRIARLEAAS